MYEKIDTRDKIVRVDQAEVKRDTRTRSLWGGWSWLSVRDYKEGEDYTGWLKKMDISAMERYASYEELFNTHKVDILN